MVKYILFPKDIHTPQPAKIVPADKSDVEFQEKIKDEPTVDIFMDESQCQDYRYDRITKQLHYPVKTYSINGHPYDLKPGLNKVPASVYEFIQQCQQDKAYGDAANRELQKPRCIAEY